MNNFTKIEQYAIIKILSCIMKADGIIEFMNQTYNDFAITVSDLEYISSIDDIQANSIVRSMTNEKKKQTLSLLVGMAKADGFIHPKEKDIISQILFA